MKKKRNRQLLVNVEERQLVLNSVVINRYPKFKKVLQKYRNISKKDIVNNEDFDDELRNLISFVFTGIKEEAETEWRGTGDVVIIDPINIKDRVQCSLCGRRNIYIFYIKNRFNDIQLNVGSECILKFPRIDNRLPEGMTLRQVKSRAVMQYQKLKRLELFNQKFPDAQNMISSWRTEYYNFPIISPTSLHKIITDIHKEANQIFERYLDGKGSQVDLNRFEELISKRNGLMIEINNFKDKNKDNKFICTKEIYDWILKEATHKERLIKTIRDSSSSLTKDTIPFIYEEKFLNKVLEDFKLMLLDTRIFIEKLENRNIYIRFKDRKRRLECQLYLSKEDFMKHFGSKLMEKNPQIKEVEIVSKAKFVFNENNCNIIKEEIEEILKGTNFKVKLNFSNIKYGLEFINRAENIYCEEIDTNTFFNAQKNRILLNGKNGREEICEVIASIKKWRPLSDKEKYNIGDITKKPEEQEFDKSVELSEA